MILRNDYLLGHTSCDVRWNEIMCRSLESPANVPSSGPKQQALVCTVEPLKYACLNIA